MEIKIPWVKIEQIRKNIVEPDTKGKIIIKIIIMIQGIKRGSDFIPKKRKDSFYPIISKITVIHDDGTLEFQTERASIDL